MSFLTFLDTNQTLFDDNCVPLQGRLRFYSIGTTTPKTVFQDLVNTPASNPQYTNSSSTLENQIFLDIGDYTVYFQRYLGSDINQMKTAPDEDFLTYKQCDLNGPNALPVNSTPNAVTVNTIADLRTVDPTVYQVVEVLGYYSVNDNIPPRTYYFSSSSISNDNFGTIIKPNALGTGRWLMGEVEEIDVRYFGIFPNGTSYNSNLTALISWVGGSTSKCKSIRFVTGNYSFASATFYFQNKLILEPNVKFINATGIGSLDIHIMADYDIQTANPLVVDEAALQYVHIYFIGSVSTQINRQVKSSWYGNWSNSSTGDNATMNAIGLYVSHNYELIITAALYVPPGRASYWTIDKITSYGPAIINKGGSLVIQGADINNYGSISMFTTEGDGVYNGFTLSNCTVRSSCFIDESSFQLVLNGLQLGGASNSTFIFDCDVNMQGDSVAPFTDNGTSFRFKRESGIISSYAGEVYSKFKSFELPTQQAFQEQSYISLAGQDSKLCYFGSNANAMNATIRSAAMGNGVADLCGSTVTLSADFHLYSLGYPHLIIKNGSVISTTYSMIIANTTVNEIQLKDFTFYSESTGTIIKVDASGYVNRITTDNCDLTSNSGTLFITTAGGTVSFFEMKGSKVVASYLMNETTVGIDEIFIHDNINLQCDLVALESKPLIANNYIQGGLIGAWTLKNKNSAIIDGNRFYQCDVYARDNVGNLDHVITNNQFESTDSKYSRIMIDAVTSSTAINGMVITGNSFTGSLTSATSAIGFGSTNFATSGHKLLIADNNSSQSLILCQTKGSNWTQFTKGQWDAAGNTDNQYDTGDITSALLVNNLFRIPNDTTNYYSVVGNTVYHKYDGATAKFSPGMNFAGAYIKPDGTLVSTYMIMMFGGLVGTSYYVATRITYEVYN